MQQDRGANLIRRGVKFGRSGQLEHGILYLLEGLSQIDEREEPRLALSAYHNMALFLTNMRMTVLARAVMVRARRLYRQVGDPVMEARLIWLQGTLARLAENLPLARHRLRQAMKRFEELKKNRMAAQVYEELRSIENALAKIAHGADIDTEDPGRLGEAPV